jgi:hypothetical protein
MAHLSPLRLYRIRDAPEETFRRREGNIRVRLPTKLPKRAVLTDEETQVIRRKSGESITRKRHALKSDLD